MTLPFFVTCTRFLFRINTAAAAYGEGTNDTGIVGRVFWCGRSVRKSRDAYKKSDGERPRYATLASAFNLRDSKKEKVLVPVSARVTALRLHPHTVDCVLESSNNYPKNWSGALTDIPEAVLAQFQRLVPSNTIENADYVILCTGLRADFRCYSLAPIIQQQAIAAQTRQLVGTKGTAALAFVDNKQITTTIVPTFDQQKGVCVSSS
jgi:hypothetical protein